MNAIIGVLFCLLLGVSIHNYGFRALFWFPLGFVFALYVAAQMFLPVVLGIPRAISLLMGRKIPGAALVRILVAPIVWFVLLSTIGFFMAYFFPSAAHFLCYNTALILGMALGAVAILLSSLSAKTRKDFGAFFDKTYVSAPSRNEIGDRTELKRCNEIAFAFCELMEERAPLIGDCSILPYSKAETLYALQIVRIHYGAKQEIETEPELKERYDDMVQTLRYLITRLARDWQNIAPEDKDAVAMLKEQESWPDWALPLREKYCNDEKGREEAFEAAHRAIVEYAKSEKVN